MRQRRAAIDVINSKIESIPVNRAELARRADIDAELLRRSLNGERKLCGDELVNLCEVLGITMDDFYMEAV